MKKATNSLGIGGFFARQNVSPYKFICNLWHVIFIMKVVKNMQKRIEQDSIGKLTIDDSKYYGISTLRAHNNFKLNVRRTDLELIKQVAQLKIAAAIANKKVGRISAEKAHAICLAAQEVLAGKFDDQFILPEIQGGAGTSTNMNVNEVIANRALVIMGHQKGEYQYLSPQDDVNAGQSTNDVYPSAGKLTALLKAKKLDNTLNYLISKLNLKALEFADVKKMGRTQLQEAVTTTLGNTFHAFASALARDQQLLERNFSVFDNLNLGGTAIGTGVNVSAGYKEILYAELRKIYHINLQPAADMLDGTQNLDTATQVSGSLKTLATSIIKMSNDLRLMASGPKSGFNEIHLPARQAGSSIMPGKVNPVIPEVAQQIAFEVMGNDTTITLAASSGEFELNAFEPVIFHNLFESIDLLTEACEMLADECIVGITANKQKCQHDVDNSAETITSLTPIIGYETATGIVKESIKTGTNVYKILREKVKDNEIGHNKQISAYLEKAGR